MNTLFYEKGYKYQVRYDFELDTNIIGYSAAMPFHSLQPDGKMFFKMGYAWDGASGPTIDTANSIVPALFHDGCYQFMRAGLLPDTLFHKVNDEFHRLLLERKMWKLRADAWWRGVESFGSAHAAVQPERIYTAK